MSTTAATPADTGQSASAAAMSVIAAADPLSHKAIHIGDRTYVMRELLFRHSMMLGNVVSTELSALDEMGLLDLDRWVVFTSGDLPGMLQVIEQVWMRLPHLMGKVLALMLSGTEGDDAEYILAHITNAQFLDVINGFMDANAWEDLIASFFTTWRRAKEGAAKLRARLTIS